MTEKKNMLVVVVVYKQRAHHYHHHHHHQTEASCDRQTNQPTKQNKTGQNRNRRQKKAASLWCIHRHTSTNTHYSYCKREEYSVLSSAQFFDKKYTRTHLPASLGLPSPAGAGAGAGGKHRPPRRHKHILCLILLFLFRSEMHDEKIGWWCWFWCWWYFRCWVPCSPTFSHFPSPAAEQSANLASNSAGRVNAGYVGSISCWTSADSSSSSSDVQRRPPDIQISAQTVHRTSTQTQTGKLKPAWV